MTDVRTFKADSMQQALELVRQEMGADAVILHTRQVTPRRLLPWKKARPEVEITAGLGVNVRQPSQRRRAQRQTAEAVEAQPQRPAAPATQPTLGDYLQNRELRGESNPALESLARIADQLDSISFSPESMRKEPAQAPTPAPTRLPRLEAAKPPRPTRISRPPQSSARSAEFASKLDNIQRMLENLSRTGHIGHEREIPGELFALYTELIDADTEDDVARNLVSRLKQQC